MHLIHFDIQLEGCHHTHESISYIKRSQYYLEGQDYKSHAMTHARAIVRKKENSKQSKTRQSYAIPSHGYNAIS
jgi:hypothetical protein